MIVDFHTHTFPDSLANKVVHKLSLDANIKNYSDGSLEGLTSSMSAAGIDYSVSLSVATKAAQTEGINCAAIKLNEVASQSGVISFGAIHPDNEDYVSIIKGLASAGIKGIKIHPIFCNIPINDIRFKRILACASENDMIVITHAGFDVGFPGNECLDVDKIYEVIKEVEPTKLVLAHMGGWAQWEKVLEKICGTSVYIDTSFSITPLRESEYWDAPIKKSDGSVIIPDKSNKIIHSSSDQLSLGLFLDIVRLHGADKFLFGTDSPWGSQSENLEWIKKSGLNDKELNLILGENARKLLNL